MSEMGRAFTFHNFQVPPGLGLIQQLQAALDLPINYEIDDPFDREAEMDSPTFALVPVGAFGALEFERGELTDTWDQDGVIACRWIELPAPGYNFVVVSGELPVGLYIGRTREMHWLGSELRRRIDAG